MRGTGRAGAPVGSPAVSPAASPNVLVGCEEDGRGDDHDESRAGAAEGVEDGAAARDGREGGKHRQADGQPDGGRDEVPGGQTRR